MDAQRRKQAREYDARRADAAEAAIRRIDAAGTKAAVAIIAIMRQAFIDAGTPDDELLAEYVDEFVADMLPERMGYEDEMDEAGFDYPDRPDYTSGAETPPTSPLPKGAV